ncbi:hypothetical protein OUZ56_009248 [Daphnia magna]|uniref:Uncharacterized protein n=1 Tax=Daphnia magna TaxID=35525 RepID=A0ABR0AFF5_9CRUS|nr:hypothetical protein OUZ56_009248 [Daphnia magna]
MAYDLLVLCNSRLWPEDRSELLMLQSSRLRVLFHPWVYPTSKIRPYRYPEWMMPSLIIKYLMMEKKSALGVCLCYVLCDVSIWQIEIFQLRDNSKRLMAKYKLRTDE